MRAVSPRPTLATELTRLAISRASIASSRPRVGTLRSSRGSPTFLSGQMSSDSLVRITGRRCRIGLRRSFVESPST